MTSIDVGFGLTLNYETKSIAFIRLDARINGLEVGEHTEDQFRAVDSNLDDAVSYLKNRVAEKIKEMSK